MSGAGKLDSGWWGTAPVETRRMSPVAARLKSTSPLENRAPESRPRCRRTLWRGSRLAAGELRIVEADLAAGERREDEADLGAREVRIFEANLSSTGNLRALEADLAARECRVSNSFSRRTEFCRRRTSPHEADVAAGELRVEEGDVAADELRLLEADLAAGGTPRRSELPKQTVPPENLASRKVILPSTNLAPEKSNTLFLTAAFSPANSAPVKLTSPPRTPRRGS